MGGGGRIGAVSCASAPRLPFPSPPARPNAARMRLLLILLLWASGLGAAAQFAKVGLILPELSRLYPDWSLGPMVSAISLVGIVLGLVAGVLAAGWGFKRVLVGSLALGAAVSFAQAAGLSTGWMLASRVVEGAAHLGIVVAAPTLIASLAPERWRGAAMTLWGTFFGVAFAAVAWAGLPLAQARGPEALWLWHGLFMALAALVLLAALPREEARPVRLRAGEVWRRHREAWSSPWTAAPAAGWLFYTFTFVALASVLPGTVAAADRAFVAGAMPLASIASSMTLGVWLLARVGAVRVVELGFVLAAATVVLLAFLPGSVWLPVLLFAALGLVQGASFAAVPELVASDRERALANGAMAQAGNTGNAVGTPVLLFAVATGGFGFAMGLVALCLAGGLAAHLLLRRVRAAGAPSAA